MPFFDRKEAGRLLAERFEDDTTIAARPVVIGLPRGGVPVAAELAAELGADLDVLVAHKLGAPAQPEFAVGAVAHGGSRVVDERSLKHARVSDRELDEIERRTRAELASRARRLRRRYAGVPVQRRQVIVTDDGAATGMTAIAACHKLRDDKPARITVALPVASKEALAALDKYCDDIVCVEVPSEFISVGEWYEKFGQTSDDEVLRLLGIEPRDVRRDEMEP